MNDKGCVVNGRLFYFNNDGKLELFYMQKQIFLVLKINNSVLFIERTELNWN